MASNNPKIPRPFKLDTPYSDPVRRALFSLVASPLEHSLGLSRLNNMYADVVGNVQDERNFLEKTLAALDVRYAASAEDIARIPTKGPVIVVSNHPFGGLDGVILAAQLRKVRPDVKVMANYLLGRIPDLREFMIYVDPFGGSSAVRNNIRAIKSAIEWVNSGGMLTIFPAGEVSHIDVQKRAIIDPTWSATVARIVQKTKAPVLPVFFDGSNSKMFNLLGLIHPLLRTALLPREFLNKGNTTIHVQIGNLIPFKKLETFTNETDMTAYLRLRTYVLQNRARSTSSAKKIKRPQPKMDPIAPARDPELLLDEVLGLPKEHLLLEHGDYQVYCARAAQIPQILYEIGRLREMTFRGVAEGTGKALDLDRFDEAYHHLFMWSTKKSELVGAYRLGATDEILPTSGVEGLYTSTLFQYQAQVLEQVGPALELGRSFIREEYQKSYSPLLLLWRGIGAFVTKYPRYQVLFGPVSINAEYQSFSRQLIMQFLQANNSLPKMAELIKPKNPPQVRPDNSVDLKECSTVVRDIDEVSDLVAEVESDQKGIPILLKQYLKLSGKMLGFNIDPDFGDVLDGLILVDLRQTDYKLLERFTGAEGAVLIRAYGKAHPVK